MSVEEEEEEEEIEMVDLRVQLPKAMVERMDEIVEERRHGFDDRDEFLREAIRKIFVKTYREKAVKG